MYELLSVIIKRTKNSPNLHGIQIRFRSSISLIMLSSQLFNNPKPLKLLCLMAFSSSIVTSTTKIQHLVSTKLDASNYLIWRAQFVALLRSHRLMKFVDGTYPCPPATLTVTIDDAGKTDDGGKTNTKKEEDNPAHETWKQQDHTIISWIFSTLYDPILALVAHLETSAAIWTTIQGKLASKSQACTMQLQRDFRTIRKGESTMSDYLLKAKTLADNLATAGDPISDHAFQQIVLSGLDTSYDSIVTTLTATVNSQLFSMDDFMRIS